MRILFHAVGQWCGVADVRQLAMCRRPRKPMMRTQQDFQKCIGGALSAFCLCILVACQAKRATPTPASPSHYSPLSRVQGGTAYEFWHGDIKRLNPITFYGHHGHLVVVLAVAGGIESGKYIINPLSSYLPKDGDDGFTFTSPTVDTNLACEVYDYRRTLKGAANRSQPFCSLTIPVAAAVGPCRSRLS